MRGTYQHFTTAFCSFSDACKKLPKKNKVQKVADLVIGHTRQERQDIHCECHPSAQSHLNFILIWKQSQLLKICKHTKKGSSFLFLNDLKGSWQTNALSPLGTLVPISYTQGLPPSQLQYNRRNQGNGIHTSLSSALQRTLKFHCCLDNVP